MSEPVARVGDRAHSDTDTHLVGGMPVIYPVTGSFTQGSPDHFVNSQPVVRQGDGGIHSACSGPNTFYAVNGSSTVYVNSLPAVRDGDSTYHCSDVPGAGMGTVLPFCSYDTFYG